MKKGQGMFLFFILGKGGGAYNPGVFGDVVCTR